MATVRNRKGEISTAYKMADPEGGPGIPCVSLSFKFSTTSETTDSMESSGHF